MNGAGYTVTESGRHPIGNGITLSNRSDVTVRNMTNIAIAIVYFNKHE